MSTKKGRGIDFYEIIFSGYKPVIFRILTQNNYVKKLKARVGQGTFGIILKFEKGRKCKTNLTTKLRQAA